MLAAHAGLASGFTADALGSFRVCFRSKAVWGYDPEFMALMPAVLGSPGENITAGDVWVATGAEGQIAGVLALAPGDEPGALDLNRAAPHPAAASAGCYSRAPSLRRVSAAPSGLTILADPNTAVSTNARARCGSARRPRARCPAVCCRSMSSLPGRQIQALRGHQSRSGRSMSLRIRSG
jgi:hypothetical protein